MSRMRLGPSALAALLGTQLLTPAYAQEPPPPAEGEAGEGQGDLVLPRPNQGHFFSLGLLSTSTVGFDTARPDRRWTPGVGVSLQLGEAVTDWLDLGLGVTFGKTYGPDDDRLAFGRLTLHSQWYLDPHWFARLDIGAASVAGRDPQNPTRDRGGYGEVYAVGVGHDFFLSPEAQSGGWVLSPVLGVDLIPSDGLTAVVSWVGLEVSFWTGLSKDKLRLEADRAFE